MRVSCRPIYVGKSEATLGAIVRIPRRPSRLLQQDLGNRPKSRCCSVTPTCKSDLWLRRKILAEAYLIEALRTAGGRRGGKLAGWHPADLGAEVLNAIVDRSGID